MVVTLFLLVSKLRYLSISTIFFSHFRIPGRPGLLFIFIVVEAKISREIREPRNKRKRELAHHARLICRIPKWGGLVLVASGTRLPRGGGKRGGEVCYSSFQKELYLKIHPRLSSISWHLPHQRAPPSSQKYEIFPPNSSRNLCK